MKHGFLRRLSALALVLVMAATLCTPAWAEDEGGEGGNTQSKPTPEITQLIVLENHTEKYKLTVTGLAVDDEITWEAKDGAAVSESGPVRIKADDENATTGNKGKQTTVTVSLTGTGENPKVIAHFTRPADGNTPAESRDLPVCYVYCREEGHNTVPIQLGTFNTGVAAVAVGGTVTRTVTIFEGYEDIIGGITFKSGGSSYAEVEKTEPSAPGKNSYTATIKGVKESAPIQIEIRSLKWENCLLGVWNLAVKAPSLNPATSLLLSHTRHTMAPTEQTFKLTATVTPKDTTDEITWSSSDEKLATVDKNGLVTRKSAGSGTVVITANAGTSGEISDTCTITLETAPSKLELSKTNLTLGYNTVNAPASEKLKATPSGEGFENATTFTWTSSNENVAKVGEDGTVEAKAAGTATITAEADFGTADKPKKLKATCAVIVIDNKSTLVDTITLSGKTDSVPEGGTATLTAAVSPSNASDKTVTWASSDSSVATVDQKGVVTALKAGETTIYGTAIGGARGTYRLTVTPKAEAIRLSGGFSSSNPTENTYAYTFGNTGNDRFTVRATLTPAKAADPIRWWVAEGGEHIVTVSSSAPGTEAVIRAKDPGSTTVYAIPKDHEDKDRKEVTPARITVTVSGITLDSTSLTLAQGRRQELNATAWGIAYSGDHSCEWISSDPAVVTVSPASGANVTLNARAPGSALITASKGAFTATCSVTVTEDTAGVITASNGRPGVALGFNTLLSQLQAACRAKTDSELAYITNLSVSSTDQGILHDDHYSADDTGAGVGVQDRYYPGTAPQGQRSLNDLSFVPRTTFSGTAEINYTAWSANNQSVSGVIQITVSGTGDVMYSSGNGSAVRFQASDFNRIHPNVRSVSFTPPQESVGTLYYKYSSSSQPGTRVMADDTYNRTGTPSLDDVYFVPAAAYQGTARIGYKGTDSAGKAFTGTVTVNVGTGSSASAPTDISYSVRKYDWVTFDAGDFNTASRYALGEMLSHVRFSLPASDQGTLFCNYRGFSEFDSTVSSSASYYYSGTPALGSISFVPTTTTPGRVDIPYTGYTTRGNTFTGTVHITLGSVGQEAGGPRYTVFSGWTVNLNAADFNAACVAATGNSLGSIQFTQLPGVSQGTLRYTRGGSSTPGSVSAGDRFYRTGSSTSNLIGSVYFQAGANYAGTVSIPFTGTSANGVTFSDVVTIVVTPPASSEITLSGTTASPIQLSSARISAAASGVLGGALSYITFNNVPDSSVGKLYLGYSGFGTGAQVSTGTRYYVSGTPGIDQISFVPRGRLTGQVGVGYTAVSSNGRSVSGRIMFSITSNGNSEYFTDMYNHTWAAPSVDYLYQNGVVKGITATAFGPGRQIKRCDFVLMLCRAFKLSGANGYSFADVPTDAYYSQAVATAKRLGIVSGDGTNFHPDSQLTRQDAMVMIYNALNAAGWNVAPASSSVLSRFSDSGSVSDYARNAVSALVQLGAVNGSTSGRLNPRNPITRAEAAIILHFIMTM